MISSTKDKIISDSHSQYYFRYLPWDSNFFERPSYYLDMNKSRPSRTGNIKYRIAEGLHGAFVTAKIDSGIDYQVVRILQDAGFRFIETEITLELTRKELVHSSFTESISIKKIAHNTNLPYEALGSVFNQTRFHTDPSIDNTKADKLWISYLVNYRPDENHHMFIAQNDSNTVGVILANTHEKDVFLYFVAILEDHRDMGIGSLLLSEIIPYFHNYTIITGTQAKNIKAINFYIKNGFTKISSTKTVLHLS